MTDAAKHPHATHAVGRQAGLGENPAAARRSDQWPIRDTSTQDEARRATTRATSRSESEVTCPPDRSPAANAACVHDWRFAQATHVYVHGRRHGARVYYCTRCLAERVVRVGR